MEEFTVVKALPRIVVLPLLCCLAACSGTPSAVTGDSESSAVVEALPSALAAPTGPFIRVLGTAQDGGFPHAACSCSRCLLARQEISRRRLVASLSVVLPAGGLVYLVDATPDIREQLTRLDDVRDPPGDRVDRSPVDGLFLTHAHIGHYLGLSFFGFEAVHTRGLPVYGTSRMSTFLGSNAPWDQLVSLENIDLIELRIGQPITLSEGVLIEALWVPHRDEYTDTVAYRIRGPRRTVLYVPDTDPWAAWSPPLSEVLEGVDVALLDGSFYSADELPGRSLDEIRHPLITDSMERLQNLVDEGLVEVYFTHLNHSNPVLDAGSTEKAAVESRGFRILEDLQEIPL